MPIFDYRCKQCGTAVEILLRSLDAEVRCPRCGSLDMERLVSASCIVKMDGANPAATCCGRAERCEEPPCSNGDMCRR
jgi:putative FmdB family regulatory protein